MEPVYILGGGRTDFKRNLGFKRRERYYAGEEAGWGAQIVEQPIEGITIFDDVDLNPDEVEVDFSRRSLHRSRRSAQSGSGAVCTARAFSRPGCTTWNAGSISRCCAISSRPKV
ncbi:MAG: hypothetical protein H0W20_11125 [Chthoniobacterales bacterium]|nr:hypothetical protein [Chthoniobacterales bacterium]